MEHQILSQQGGLNFFPHKSNNNMWKIIDNKGTLYSGNEEDIKIIFDQIRSGKIQEKWYGDLLLVQVHDIHR